MTNSAQHQPKKQRSFSSAFAAAASGSEALEPRRKDPRAAPLSFCIFQSLHRCAEQQRLAHPSICRNYVINYSATINSYRLAPTSYRLPRGPLLPNPDYTLVAPRLPLHLRRRISAGRLSLLKRMQRGSFRSLRTDSSRVISAARGRWFTPVIRDALVGGGCRASEGFRACELRGCFGLRAKRVRAGIPRQALCCLASGPRKRAAQGGDVGELGDGLEGLLSPGEDSGVCSSVRVRVCYACGPACSVSVRV